MSVQRMVIVVGKVRSRCSEDTGFHKKTKIVGRKIVDRKIADKRSCQYFENTDLHIHCYLFLHTNYCCPRLIHLEKLEQLKVQQGKEMQLEQLYILSTISCDMLDVEQTIGVTSLWLFPFA